LLYRLLGVVLSDRPNLNFDGHVSYVLSICSQRLYLTELLRSKGMPGKKLHEIFVALIVSRISYALSACGGFLTGQQINRINVFFSKVRHFGLCSSTRVCDVSEYLSLNRSRVGYTYNACPTACLAYFHLRRNSVVCVIEDMVTSFPNVSIVLKNSFIPRCLFHFFLQYC